MRKFHAPAPKPKKRIMSADITEKIPVRIDERTTIYIQKGKDPEEAKRNYFNKREMAIFKQYGI